MYLSNTTEKSPKSMRDFWHIPEIDDVDREEVELITQDQLMETLKLYGAN